MKIGIVGVGQWGQRVADKISKLEVDGEKVSITAHCRKGNDPVPRFGRLLSLSELVFSDDVDVIVAMAPPATTLLAASGAIRAKKPILVTKPFLLTEDFTPVSPLVVDFVRLWSPCWRMFKDGVLDKIAAGSKVVNIDVRFGGKSGGGFGPVRGFPSIFDYGPHVFAFLYDLLGTDAVFVPKKVLVDDVEEGTQVYTVEGIVDGADLSLVTGNGLDASVKHFRATMDDGSFFCYIEESNTCACIGPGTVRTKQVHVEWNHNPLQLMLMNFLLDCRLGVIDSKTYIYSRLGISACNLIEQAGVAG